MELRVHVDFLTVWRDSGWCGHDQARLRAVSLFLENPWERTQNKKTCKRDCERDLRATMPQAASSVGVGRRVKRETALVLYNDLMLL